MGCCLSAGDHNLETDRRSSIDGAPPTSPRAAIEEETVKEVLLETPLVPKNDERIKGMPPGNRDRKAEAGPTAAAIHRNPNPPEKDSDEIVSEVSEVSEMYSYSESFSNVTAPEKKDDDEDGVVNQRPPPRKRRTHSGGRGRGERVVSRRTAAPSPEKRGQVAPLRPVRGRPVAGQPRNAAEENGPVAGQPRNAAEENGRRMDAVEDSGRRSRSPVRPAEVASRRNASDENTPPAGEPRNDVVPADEAESLENPVVSLECFIFL